MEDEYDDPKLVIHDASRGAPAATVATLSGTRWWNEEVQGRQFPTTILKLPHAAAQQLVQNSGYRGIFTCELGKQKSDTKVYWHPKAPEEDASSYLERVRAIAQERKEGLLLRKGGGAELGLLATANQMFDHKHSHWVVSGCPKEWQEDEVCQFIQEQSSTSRKHTSRRALTGGCRLSHQQQTTPARRGSRQAEVAALTLTATLNSLPRLVQHFLDVLHLGGV